MAKRLHRIIKQSREHKLNQRNKDINKVMEALKKLQPILASINYPAVYYPEELAIEYKPIILKQKAIFQKILRTASNQIVQKETTGVIKDLNNLIERFDEVVECNQMAEDIESGRMAYDLLSLI